MNREEDAKVRPQVWVSALSGPGKKDTMWLQGAEFEP